MVMIVDEEGFEDLSEESKIRHGFLSTGLIDKSSSSELEEGTGSFLFKKKLVILC
jgi:hypothetical protein